MSSDKQPRSSFVLKLHQLLSAETHPEYLHWLNNDTFAITSIDANARIALAPQWDFRSLSSFIRQLSYYSFKRLSDRRRSAERRSSMPSYIVFTHPSGQFVRDDQSKALQIPRKLRARKPTTKRKNSTASSAADRSPTPPDDGFDGYDDGEQANGLQSGLANYQLAPWNAQSSLEQGRTIRSAPRSIPNAAPTQVQLPPHAALHEEATVYTSSSYPSPMSAPATSSFFPSQAYYPSSAQAPSGQEHPVYYYSSAQSGASTSQVSGSPFSTYAPDQLPPLRTIASGLVAPPSPPPEQQYAQSHHYSPQRRPIREEDERTPSPMPVHATIHAPQPIALPSVAQLDSHHFYPPSPPKQHQHQQHQHVSAGAYYTTAPHHLAQHGSSVYHSSSLQHHHAQEVKPAFYHLSGQDSLDYPTTTAPLTVSHA
ncbi:hypothetical protein JCM8097_003121 [Rhodosporidiobolus ruineniae]